MSIVVLQLGQGGNQMGCALFQSLASTTSVSSPSAFFHSSKNGLLIARSVLIDMEPKVVESMFKRSRATSKQGTPWTYNRHRQITEDSGAGNNWARGYHDYGPQCRDAVVDAVRLEVEMCDMFGGFLTLQSMAGGTGAGLGAYVVEALSEEFPSSFVLSHCIWPHESGEVVVQNYNVLLTMAHLQAFADGVVIVQNEQLSSICRSSLGMARPSFDDMNAVASQALTSLLLPSYWRPTETTSRSRDHLGNDGAGSRTRVRILSDLLSTLCGHPGYRMLSLHFAPQIRAQSLEFTTFTWESELRHLRQMLMTGVHKDLELDWSAASGLPKGGAGNAGGSSRGHNPINRSIANLLVLRGEGSEHANVTAFADERLYPVWSVDPLAVAACRAPLGRYDMAAGLLNNGPASVLPASRALSRAYGMYSARAYVHQYLAHGMESARFDDTFATVEDVISRYLTI